jgi:hypothetical protein
LKEDNKIQHRKAQNFWYPTLNKKITRCEEAEKYDMHMKENRK